MDKKFKSLDEVRNFLHSQQEVNVIELVNNDSFIRLFISELPKNDREKYLDVYYSNMPSINEEYEWGTPTCHHLPKPKGGEREIFVYPIEDRLIQKLLNWILSVKFDMNIHKSVFSYRQGISRLHAAKYILLEARGSYSAKVDISDYFRQVPKDIIYKCIDNLEIDDNSKILMKSHFNVNSYWDIRTGELIYSNMGLTAGSALGAFFANLVLSEVDNVMTGKCKKYARYCDDMLIVGNSQDNVDELITLLKEELGKLGLTIKDKKTMYFNPNDTINFLGLDITNGKIDISKESFENIKKGIKKICKRYRKAISYGEVTPEAGLIMAVNRFNKIYIEENPYKEDDYKPLSTVLQVVNCVDTVRLIDFYLVDRLQWVYTGVNNKANVRKMPREKLTNYGYINLNVLYMDYKASNQIYKFKAQRLRYEKLSPIDYNNNKDIEIKRVQRNKSNYKSKRANPRMSFDNGGINNV